MLTDQHPITPPPELVAEWCAEWYRLKVKINTGIPEYVATQAARWGADQELEGCCEWLRSKGFLEPAIEDLRDVRRPKPPSLAEQALEACERSAFGIPGDRDIIRRALKRLQELENNDN